MTSDSKHSTFVIMDDPYEDCPAGSMVEVTDPAGCRFVAVIPETVVYEPTAEATAEEIERWESVLGMRVEGGSAQKCAETVTKERPPGWIPGERVAVAEEYGKILNPDARTEATERLLEYGVAKGYV